MRRKMVRIVAGRNSSFLPFLPPALTGRTESGPVGEGMRGKLVLDMAGLVSLSPPPPSLPLIGRTERGSVGERIGQKLVRVAACRISPPPSTPSARVDVMPCHLLLNPNKHGPFWHLNNPGCCAYHVALPVVPFSCTLLGPGVIRRPSVTFPAKFLVTSRKTADFDGHFGPLTVIRFKIFFSCYRLTLYEQRMSKKLGSYHSKSHFLGLQKSLLEPIFSL